MSTPLLHRQVLAAIGGSSIGRCIVHPNEGVASLRASRYGSSTIDHRGKFTARQRPWPTAHGFDCQPEGITVAPVVDIRTPWTVVPWPAVTKCCTEIAPQSRATVEGCLEAERTAHATLLPYDSRMEWPEKQAYKVSWDAYLVESRSIAVLLEDAIDAALELDVEQEPDDLFELLAMGASS